MGELQLIQQQREKILSVAGEHGMVNVRLFGSVARGEETPDSASTFMTQAIVHTLNTVTVTTHGAN